MCYNQSKVLLDRSMTEKIPGRRTSKMRVVILLIVLLVVLMFIPLLIVYLVKRSQRLWTESKWIATVDELAEVTIPAQHNLILAALGVRPLDDPISSQESPSGSFSDVLEKTRDYSENEDLPMTVTEITVYYTVDNGKQGKVSFVPEYSNEPITKGLSGVKPGDRLVKQSGCEYPILESCLLKNEFARMSTKQQWHTGKRKE